MHGSLGSRNKCYGGHHVSFPISYSMRVFGEEVIWVEAEGAVFMTEDEIWERDIFYILEQDIAALAP